MGSIDEVFEILGCTEVRVDLVPVLCPVSVVSIWRVQDYWRDPDGIEAHAGDVAEVVLDSFPVSTAVGAKVIAACSVAVCLGKSIG